MWLVRIDRVHTPIDTFNTYCGAFSMQTGSLAVLFLLLDDGHHEVPFLGLDAPFSSAASLLSIVA